MKRLVSYIVIAVGLLAIMSSFAMVSTDPSNPITAFAKGFLQGARLLSEDGSSLMGLSKSIVLVIGISAVVFGAYLYLQRGKPTRSTTVPIYHGDKIVAYRQH